MMFKLDAGYRPMLTLTRVLVVLLMASLPFHRPAVVRLLGPAAALPEMLFAPTAFAAALAWGRLAPRKLGWAWVLVIVPMLPAVFASSIPFRSATQLLVLAYATSLFVLGAAMTAAGEAERDRALLALVAGAAAAALLGLCGLVLDAAGIEAYALAVHYPWMGALPRPLGPTESPTMLAIVVLGGWLGAHHLARRERLGPGAWRVASLFFAAMLLLTESRGVLAAIAAVGALLWQSERVIVLASPQTSRYQGRGARQIVGAILIVLALVATLASVAWRIVPLQPSWPWVNTSASPYRVCHEIAWRTFVDHPGAGVGLEAFHTSWPVYYEPARYDAAYAGGAEEMAGLPLDPHGTWQGYAAEGGLPALLGLVLLASAAVRMLRRKSSHAPELSALLAAIAIASIFMDVLTERSTWALMGLFWFRSTGAKGTASKSVKGASPRLIE